MFRQFFLEKKIPLLADLLAPKMGQNRRFLAISGGHTKNLFCSNSNSGQHIMSPQKQNIHFRHPFLTDWTPQPQKSIKSSQKSPP